MRNITLLAKRIYRAVFSRLVLTGLLLLSQIVWVAFLFFRLTEYAPWINGICIGFSFIMCLLLIRLDYIQPEFKISWMALFLIMPCAGRHPLSVMGQQAAGLPAAPPAGKRQHAHPSPAAAGHRPHGSPAAPGPPGRPDRRIPEPAGALPGFSPTQG